MASGDPVETFIGWTAIGFGIILVYAAINNKGPIKDIVKPALTTGKIPSFRKPGTPSPAPKGTDPTVAVPITPAFPLPFGGYIPFPGVAN